VRVSPRLLGAAAVWRALSAGPASVAFFFFNDTATTEIYTLSLHDALPISSNNNSGTEFRGSTERMLRGALTATRRIAQGVARLSF